MRWPKEDSGHFTPDTKYIEANIIFNMTVVNKRETVVTFRLIRSLNTTNYQMGQVAYSV